MAWHIVVNPRAGRRVSATAAIRKGVAVRGLDASIHETAHVADLQRSVVEAVDRGVRRFVAVGGDGTAHHVVNALFGTGDGGRFTLALIPAGSGSDFVRTFGQSGDIELGLDRIADPDIYPVDVGWAEGAFGRAHFLNAVDVGVAAASVATAERLPRSLGTARYRVGFWMTLARFPRADVDVTVDHHRYRGDAITVVVANGQFFGGGLNVAPRATLTDGRFDVLVFSGPRSNAFSVMPRLLVGSHLTHPAVRRYIGANVTVTAPDSWPVEADGEMLGAGTVRMGMLPGALDYVV